MMTRKLKITTMACLLFLLDSATLRVVKHLTVFENRVKNKDKSNQHHRKQGKHAFIKSHDDT